MTNIIIVCGWILFAIVALATLAFIITSLRERRRRPLKITILIFGPLLILLALLLVSDFPAQNRIIGGLVIIFCGALALFILPFGSDSGLCISGAQQRVDERDIIFARFSRLKPGDPEFEQYYQEHPENLASDEKTRSLPELSFPGSRSYQPLIAPFSAATFDALERITRQIEWPAEPIENAPVQASPEEFARRIKGFAYYLGAKKVGITKLNRAYVYSHIGRSPGPWGEPVDLKHENALAICVEMKYEMVRHAPASPTMTETAFQYFEAAKIALIIARYINLLGYEARAHLDGNYRVMCVPIAADAGLGELGRLGLLITPEYGPRIRLSAVTTNLPLVYDKPITFGVQHFCTLCKKCAANCPSHSIPAGAKEICRGVGKWQVNQDTCYRFWRTQGTDCAVCVKVCPYSHPATPLHNLVRRSLRRNGLARRLALSADDLFYGRRPQTHAPLADWHARA